MSHDELERLVTRLLEALCRVMWGFAPRMIPHIVRSLGPGKSVVWFAANMPRLLWTMHVLGPLRTHLAAVASRSTTAARTAPTATPSPSS